MTDWKPYKIRMLGDLLMPRDIDLLESLERYRLLDARLIQELHFPVSAETHLTISAATRATNRVLMRLEGHEFIARLARRVGGASSGSSSTVWQLAATGERLLRARRGDPVRRRFIEPTALFMAHTLDIARLGVLVAASARSDRFDLLEVETEPRCWRAFQSGQGEEQLKPDLYLVTADAEIETHSLIEVDRGTEHLPAVLKKCRTYQRYWRSGKEQAELGLFPAVVWVTTDERRCGRIQDAIAGDTDLVDGLFRVTTFAGALPLIAPIPHMKGGTQ